jgi:sugar (pentulose or hexulose) kinase
MLLGLDIGTTNVKALVTTLSGQPLARGSAMVRLYPGPGGAVEQDLEEIWQAVLQAIRQAVRTVTPKAVRAIGVSSQGGAMQLLTPAGAPIGRVISWLDQRGNPFDERVNAELGQDWFLKRIFHRGSWLAVGQLLRLRAEKPAILAPPNRIGFVGDTIVSRLCGGAIHDGTSAGLTLLYNPCTQTYDPDVLARLGVQAGQLPEIFSPSQPAGSLRSTAAEQTGLAPGIPVSPAVHDQYASALGTRAVRSGTVMAGTGTAWVLLAVSDTLAAPVHNAFVCRHVVDGLCGQILSMVNGGSAVNWVLGLTGQTRLTPAALDQLLESSERGCDGLRFWPFLTRFSPPALPAGTAGRFTGLHLTHGAAHFTRAVVEGLACELARHLDLLRASGVPVRDLALGGGAAGSEVTPQILADTTGLSLRAYGGSESSLLGAAVIARGLLEPRASLAALALEMTPEGTPVAPGPRRDCYARLYEEYLASLPALKPL